MVNLLPNCRSEYEDGPLEVKEEFPSDCHVLEQHFDDLLLEHMVLSMHKEFNQYFQEVNVTD